MAILTIPDENRVVRDPELITQYLAGFQIDYERWEPAQEIPPDASADDILHAYEGEIDRLKARGGYVTADVIDVNSQTPGLETMLARFNREHWHDEDEVRLIVHGRGIFHLRPQGGPVIAIEVGSGDLLCVPVGTHHWFNLCTERKIRAIRLFQDPAGWTPHYTESGVDAGYQPVCLGSFYLPQQRSFI